MRFTGESCRKGLLAFAQVSGHVVEVISSRFSAATDRSDTVCGVGLRVVPHSLGIDLDSLSRMMTFGRKVSFLLSCCRVEHGHL